MEENKVILRNRGDRHWAEVLLCGLTKRFVKVDVADLATVRAYRWFWHPRGVFARRQGEGNGVFLARLLRPDVSRIFYANSNRLDCRRENLLSQPAFRRHTRYNASPMEGVIYRPERDAYMARIEVGGIQAYAWFNVSDYGSNQAAKSAAIEQRQQFVRMSRDEVAAFKGKKSPLCEEEKWIGEDLAAHIAQRVKGDAAAAAQKGFEAGLMASRVLGKAVVLPGRHNGRVITGVSAC